MGRHRRVGIPAGWQAEAICRDADAELFFAPDGKTTDARQRREAAAKLICEGCPVRSRCLSWSLEMREPEGIWGGTTEEERRALRRSRSSTPAATAADRVAIA